MGLFGGLDDAECATSDEVYESGGEGSDDVVSHREPDDMGGPGGLLPEGDGSLGGPDGGGRDDNQG